VEEPEVQGFRISISSYRAHLEEMENPTDESRICGELGDMEPGLRLWTKH
jgi:hypothetical protein